MKGNFPFNLEIFRYNSKTRLFLAEGNDEFGESSIIGAICLDSKTLKFDKYYRDTNLPFFLNDFYDSKDSLFREAMFRKVFFSGIFGGEPLDFGGRYFYPSAKELAGSWNMIKSS